MSFQCQDCGVCPNCRKAFPDHSHLVCTRKTPAVAPPVIRYVAGTFEQDTLATLPAAVLLLGGNVRHIVAKTYVVSQMCGAVTLSKRDVVSRNHASSLPTPRPSPSTSPATQRLLSFLHACKRIVRMAALRKFERLPWSERSSRVTLSFSNGSRRVLEKTTVQDSRLRWGSSFSPFQRMGMVYLG